MGIINICQHVFVKIKYCFFFNIQFKNEILYFIGAFRLFLQPGNALLNTKPSPDDVLLSETYVWLKCNTCNTICPCYLHHVTHLSLLWLSRNKIPRLFDISTASCFMFVICSSIMVLAIDISIQHTKAVSKVVMIYNNVIYSLLTLP